MNKLSVAIVTFNEERFIEGCLKSVSWADEIIVIDGKSQDKTASIAKSFKAKVFEVENQPLMKKMMNLAFEKCSGDWVLSLDADERVTLELKSEILEIIKISQSTAYKIPRKNLIFGKYLEHTGWYPDFQTRLFKNGKAKFPAKNVHEELIVDGDVGTLTGDIEHLHYFTVDQWLKKMTSYTLYEAEKLLAEGYKFVWADAIIFPMKEFFSRFFLREGYKDGLHGLVLSLLMAFYWEIIFVRLWEKSGFKEYNSDKFLEEVVGQANEVRRFWNYWVIDKTKNKVKKVFLRYRNKFGMTFHI